MLSNPLAFGTPGALEVLIVLVFLGILVALVVVFLRLILRNKNENIRLRLEVGKLADGLEKVRKLKSAEQNVSTNKST